MLNETAPEECREAAEACRLVVKFITNRKKKENQNKKLDRLKKIAPTRQHTNITCPEGYDVIGVGCYKLVWPGKAPQKLMGVDEGFT